VGAEDDPALEAEDEVLADRIDRLEPAPAKVGEVDRGPGARVRRFDLEALPDEWLQSSRGAVERVAFGHGASVCARSA